MSVMTLQKTEMTQVYLLTCVLSKSFSTTAFSLLSCAFSSDCVSVSSKSLKDNLAKNQECIQHISDKWLFTNNATLHW